MLWWRNQDELVKLLRLQLEIEQRRFTLAQERIDRLTEALARKANVDLVMPQPIPAPLPSVYVPNPYKDPNRVTPIQEKQ